MDKQIAAYPSDGILLNYKKNKLHKKNKLIHKTTWTNLKNIMLNERSQTQKSTYYIIPFI